MAKILLVDDSQDLQECFSALLKFKHHETNSASSGNTLRLALNNFKPDLILMDVKLSGESGRTLCNKLKEDAATSAIPVILISANPDLLADPEQCHADDILEKPFNIDTLYKKINKFLHTP